MVAIALVILAIHAWVIFHLVVTRQTESPIFLPALAEAALMAWILASAWWEHRQAENGQKTVKPSP